MVIWMGDKVLEPLEEDSRDPEQDIHFLQLSANLVGAVERQQLTAQADALALARELLLSEAVHESRISLPCDRRLVSIVSRADLLHGS